MEGTELVQALKHRMGYKPAMTCCGTCKSYRPTDCSGDAGALGEHCTLNPAARIPVESAAWCKHYDPDPEKLAPYIEEEKKRNEIPF